MSLRVRLGLGGLLACLLVQGVAAVEPPRPNILLIVADDLGFSDIGCYGGEIATPNLDALAAGGLRFAQFYNTARCWPSRAALLTGYYAQSVRRDTVPGVASGTLGARPGWARLLPDLLRPLGYHSYHSGKWHIDGRPLENGFERSYSLNDHDRYFAPRLHTEDDRPLPPVAEGGGYYATTAIASHAIRCLREHSERHPGEPFFEYLAFTAPHFPVQAPPEDVARYQGRYLRGWDLLRWERWERMRGIGVGGSLLSAVERGLEPPYPFPEALARLGSNEVNRAVPWGELTPAQQRFQADKFAVHAAMVDRMDREIGRVLGQVRAMGAMENTLILFLSDNGASAEMMIRGDGHDPEAACGTGATFLSIGPGWSSMANTPFRRHKTWVHEGGISTPLIAHWPRGIAARGTIRQTPGHVVDIVPTLLEVAGGQDSGQPGQASERPPAPGRSLVPVFARELAGIHDTLWWLHEGNRALRSGQWKIVASGEESPWELYDLKEDRSESKNLAAGMPEKVRELAALWERQAGECVELASRDLPPPYGEWAHSASFHILTTAEGAALPAGALLEGFPILLRLNRDFFDFSQAATNGADLRFSTPGGVRLPYQIEEWDPASGRASIWVRVPRIEGDRRQALRMHWGRPGAPSESKGSDVFNASNGYQSVWHMSSNSPGKDEVRGQELRDTGTGSSPGVVGGARHLDGRRGLSGGNPLTNLPSGPMPHTTEGWFRVERPNVTLVGWGNEGGGRGTKVRMQLRSPPHVHVDSDFADVRGGGRVPMGEWVHVAHTFDGTEGRVFVNGRLDGTNRQALEIRSPARIWIGGWYDDFDFVGDVDEVRISRRARSADWVRLEYENQRGLQRAVGPLVQPGGGFSLSPSGAEVPEGGAMTFSAEAGGAMKLYWVLKGDDSESVVAVDSLHYDFRAGRVEGDRRLRLELRGLFADGVRSREVPLTVRESIPEPGFLLKAPAAWDGRTPAEVVLVVTNQARLAAAGVEALTVRWEVGDLAVTTEELPGRLLLKRAQNSGPVTVRATVGNGGAAITRSATLVVTEPRRDPWVARPVQGEEFPEDNQFIPRDDRGDGTLACSGTAPEGVDAVFLRVMADGVPYRSESRRVGARREFLFQVKLKAGLIHYSAQLGTRRSGRDTLLHTATNLVCGDAYVIQGQSNAVATDWGGEERTFHSEWIRTYGTMSGSPDGLRLWGEAVHRARSGERLQIGCWGMELARRLLEAERMPICILNGAVGGTRIDQHQRNRSNPADLGTLYGRLLWRARQARLTHGIRGVFWYQGENDQGADGPSGGYGWEAYRRLFLELASGWKQDFPNVQHYYVFQIWPAACAMGVEGSDNRLREVQRNLPSAFSHMSVMSTLGVEPGGECHFPAAGYSEIARLITPVVLRAGYGRQAPGRVTAPNLLRAWFPTGRRDQVVLEFDQPVRWQPSLSGEFLLDGRRGGVASGRASGNRLTLELLGPASPARTISYLDSRSWNPRNLLRGENGIAALTFYEVPISFGLPRE